MAVRKRLKDLQIHLAQGNQAQKRTVWHIVRPGFSREAAMLAIFKASGRIS